MKAISSQRQRAVAQQQDHSSVCLISQFMARKKAKKHAESKKSKGKSQVASRTEAVTLALRNRIVP